MSGSSLGFLDPKKIFNQTPLVRGWKVADFGCGSGYFSLEAARRVGDAGSVWAIDVLSSCLETVQTKAETEGLRNIICLRANVEKLGSVGIPEDSLDLVVAKDVLFQNKEKRTVLQEAKRLLKPKGILLVVEWNGEYRTIGPAMNVRLKESDAQDMVLQEGFSFQSGVSAGEYHYAFIAQKP